jgi:hypothetical protein
VKGDYDVNKIKNIIAKGNTYIDKCIVHAVAMHHLFDINNMYGVSEFLDLASSATLSALLEVTKDMETALSLSSDVGLNVFLCKMLQEKKNPKYIIGEEAYNKVHSIIYEGNDKLRREELDLTNQYGKNFNSGNSEIDEINLYKTGKTIQSHFTTIISDITKTKTEFSQVTKSAEITFIDKYEFVLQGMMDRSNQLKDILKQINFLKDVMHVAFFIWDRYCESNVTMLNGLLHNSQKDILNELTRFIKEEG